MKRLAVFVLLLAALIVFVSASADTEVYITRTGECYHRAGCSSLRRSCIPISLGDAVSRGYRACKNCDPPILTNDAPRPKPQPKAKVADAPNLVAVQLVSITDGDTIRVMVDGKEEPVRLIGIDTPEKWKKRGKGWVEDPDPFALEASAFTTKLLTGRDIWLEYDVQRRDKYDRILAHVWVQIPGESAKTLANAQIVRAGLAQLLTIPPDVKYVDRLKAALIAAKRDKLNLWAGTAEPGEDMLPK